MQFLIIEDEPAVARAIQKGLKREGHRTDIASSGSTGLAMAHGGDYDLIILDIMLPERSGFEVAAELRARGDATPILMLTALCSTEDIVKGLDAGADDYLTKPFELSELLARVRALKRRAGPGRARVTRFADLVLDEAERTARRGERPIKLTDTECRLLSALMERPGETVSRQELLERVWDIRFDPCTRVVDVHVANLRKKLEARGEERMVATVRGVGYRLVWPGTE
jgi:DNA-binding response OmpR family regulator